MGRTRPAWRESHPARRKGSQIDRLTELIAPVDPDNYARLDITEDHLLRWLRLRAGQRVFRVGEPGEHLGCALRITHIVGFYEPPGDRRQNVTVEKVEVCISVHFGYSQER